MSKEKNTIFCELLKKERKQNYPVQSEFADLVGVSTNSQSNYETGKTSPNIEYLVKLRKVGFDINYLLTGQRDSNHLSNEEKFLLDKFRKASKEKQTAVLGALLVDGDSVADAVAGQSVTVGDNNSGNVAGGDLTVGK